MLYVRIAEEANHFADSVRFADIRQEFVAQTFALRSTGNQTCNINEFHRCRDDLRRVVDGGKAVKALIGNGNQANIGLDGCKRIICSKSALLRKSGEQRRLANVRQANNANGKGHVCSLIGFSFLYAFHHTTQKENTRKGHKSRSLNDWEHRDRSHFPGFRNRHRFPTQKWRTKKKPCLRY